jgi:hypothetical protein
MMMPTKLTAALPVVDRHGMMMEVFSIPKPPCLYVQFSFYDFLALLG